jgi:hypothetical protein
LVQQSGSGIAPVQITSRVGMGLALIEIFGDDVVADVELLANLAATP